MLLSFLILRTLKLIPHQSVSSRSTLEIDIEVDGVDLDGLVECILMPTHNQSIGCEFPGAKCRWPAT